MVVIPHGKLKAVGAGHVQAYCSYIAVLMPIRRIEQRMAYAPTLIKCEAFKE